MQPIAATTSPPLFAYAQRGTNTPQSVFRDHFGSFAAQYDSRYAKELGNFRIERMSPGGEPIPFLRRLPSGHRSHSMHKFRMPPRVLSPFLMQGILPLPILQPEAILAIRRAYRPALAACPAPPPVRLHSSQGPEGVFAPRPASVRQALAAHLLPDQRVLLNSGRQAHLHRCGRRLSAIR